ncbi:MAG: folylpolyglutamate synthase/dihydrofolate synthase family protein [Lentisphaeria bacterium]|jgi:dihydrofolate synthase/folylpolyglutamate synthase|nr:folylpolyglutamate synthase/dihydrofolate synthase family protein [Lentisphaeria bacterium]
MHDAEQFLEHLQTSGIKLGLENTARLLAALDNPQRDLRVVHVAGTNGKGSVCAMIAAALTQAGYRTGLFSSPHLVTVRERFQIDGRAIDTDTFTSLICELRTKAAALFDETSHSPTYFEFITALALEYFRQAAVDFAVVEVGMGGRLDSTNLVTPLVSVITTIAHDHTGPLGDSMAAIASEKAGIIKPHVPIVCGETGATAVEAIEAVATAQQAPIYRRGHDFDVANVVLPAATGDGPLPRQSCQVSWRDHRAHLEIRLPGQHQAENAATAFATLQVLRQQGIKLPSEAVVTGIGGAKWPGRFDQRPGGIIIDVAHNPAALTRSLQLLEQLYPGRRWLVLFSVMQDKLWPEMLAALAPYLSGVILAPLAYERAVPPEVIRTHLHATQADLEVTIADSMQDGVARLQHHGGGLVIGSVFLAGAVLAIENGQKPITPQDDQ